MQDYLLIETRDFMEAGDTEWSAALALELSKKRAEVMVFLTENAVMAARATAHAPSLRALTKKGVKVVADRFALFERGIADQDLAKEIDTNDIAFVAQRMAGGARVIWR